MREVETPPLSRSIDQFAREVKNRAARLGRRKLQIAGTAVLAVVVMGIGLSVGFGSDQPAVRPTASDSGSAATTAPATGTPGPGAPSAAANAAPQSRSPALRRYATAAPAPAATNAHPASGDVVGGSAVMVDPANGGTITVAHGTQLVVSLTAPAKGHWGTLHITKGHTTVLDLVGQTADAHGGIQATLKGVAAGLARVNVPCIGNHAGSWRSTVTVS